VAALCVITGFLLSFLMVIGILEKSMLLSFVSYSISLVGLTFGLITVYDYISPKKSREIRENAK